jgi:hypothetical protein
MDYLAGDALTKLAGAYANKAGVTRPLPAGFYTGTPNPNVGTLVSYDVETASRAAAVITNPDSPSLPAPGVATINKKVAAIGTRESYTIGLDLIQALQVGGIVGNNARMELARQVKNFASRFATLRADVVHSMLLRGKIDVSSAGAVQTSTSSPIRTIDASVPTANQLTTAGAGSTYAIGDWSSAATDIPGKILGLKRYAATTYNFGIDTVFYGVNVPGYLAKNTLFKEYLARNPGFNQAYVNTGEIPNGVMGLNWVNVATATKGGGSTNWAGDNFLGFYPSLSEDWYEYIECGLPAPTGLASEAKIEAAIASAEAIGGSFPIRYGLHSYSMLNADPISAKMIVADFTLPIIKSPNAVYIGVCA